MSLMLDDDVLDVAVNAPECVVTVILQHLQAYGTDLDWLEEEKDIIFGAMTVCYQKQWWDKLVNLEQMHVEFQLARGYWIEAWQYLTWAAEACENQGADKAAAPWIHENLAEVADNQGSYESATRHYEQSLMLYKALGDEASLARVLNSLGETAVHYDDESAAIQYLEQSLLVSERLDDRKQVAHTLFRLGAIAADQGKWEQAWRYYEQSQLICERLEDAMGIARTLRGLGRVAFNIRKREEALRLAMQSADLCEQAGDIDGQTTSLLLIADCLKSFGKPKLAWQYFHEAFAISQSAHITSQFEVIRCMAEMACQQHDYETAQAYYSQLAACYRTAGDRDQEARVLANLANVAVDIQDLKLAHRYLEQSLEIYENLDQPRMKAPLLAELGNIAWMRKQYAVAEHHWAVALTIVGYLDQENAERTWLKVESRLARPLRQKLIIGIGIFGLVAILWLWPAHPIITGLTLRDSLLSLPVFALLLSLLQLIGTLYLVAFPPIPRSAKSGSLRDFQKGSKDRLEASLSPDTFGWCQFAASA